jgi:hypothetical protein
MKKLAFMLVVLLLAACAGTRQFAGDDQFRGYITKLHLSQMSVADARAKLISLGFACESQGVDVSCTKSVGNRFGSQWQHVQLSPAVGKGLGTKVKASLSTVVI